MLPRRMYLNASSNGAMAGCRLESRSRASDAAARLSKNWRRRQGATRARCMYLPSGSPVTNRQENQALEKAGIRRAAIWLRRSMQDDAIAELEELADMLLP